VLKPLALIGTVALIAGCGASATSAPSTRSSTPSPPPPTASVAEGPILTATTENGPKGDPSTPEAWSDEVVEPYTVSLRDVFEQAQDVCSTFTPEQVAREYKAKKNTVDNAAFAYATQAFRKVFRRAAYAGCMVGFRD
jgi:hypothetical protein